MASNKSIVIIGDSPATYICSIYLHTANIKHLVIRSPSDLDYKCTFVPAMDNTKEEYNQKCYEQVKNMKINIVETQNKCDVTKEGEQFVIKYDNNTVTADYLVSDIDLKIGNFKNLFIVEEKLLEKEAIVVAGVGCMIAFEIKELVN